jgi:hypothetical protein
MRNADDFFFGKSEEKRQLGRRRRRWKDNIKTDLRGIRVWKYRLNSSGSGWGPVEDSSEHDNKHSGSIKDREFIDKLSVLLASQEGLCCIELVKTK